MLAFLSLQQYANVCYSNIKCREHQVIILRTYIRKTIKLALEHTHSKAKTYYPVQIKVSGCDLYVCCMRQH